MIPSTLFRLFIRREGISRKMYVNKYIQGFGDNKMSIYSEEEPIDYLVAQFNFCKSIEGFEYWNAINERWLDFLEENNK